MVQIIPSREDSLDRLVDENARQFSDEQESVESMVLHKLEVDRLHTALSLLTPEERALIQALFFLSLIHIYTVPGDSQSAHPHLP